MTRATITQSLVAVVGIAMASALPIPTTAGPGDTADIASTPAECRRRTGLPNAGARLERGEPTTIAFIGGSITEQPGYRVQVLAWLRERYPDATIHEVDAAIGGTPSYLGAFRLRRHVLDQDPDLVVVEFAVNDLGQSSEETLRSMEGIVRQIRRADAQTDVLFVYTVRNTMVDDLRAGRNPRTVTDMERVAEHYGVPSINLGVRVVAMLDRGELVLQGPLPSADAGSDAHPIVFSGDGIHPYPEHGHPIYTEAITDHLPALFDADPTAATALAAPLRDDHRGRADMLAIDAAMLEGDWRPLTPSADRNWVNRLMDLAPTLWGSDHPGDELRFSFVGREAAVYDVLGPDCGQVEVFVNGESIGIRPRFDKFTVRHRLSWLPVVSVDEPQRFDVRIVIHPDEPDRLSILRPGRRDRYDPRTFQGTNWYPGALLIDGRLLDH